MKERLQKIIARAGVTSRRKAEELILSGRVRVNGRLVTELGSKADPERDHIKVNNKLVRLESKEYIAFHKPKGVLSSRSDDRGRPVVTDYVRSKGRLYPAGRLDFNSEGLLLLTNDGEMVRRVTQAGSLEKTYRVKVSGQPTDRDLDQLRRGIRFAREAYAPCRIRSLRTGKNCWYEIILKQGRNRQIRRMFEHIGHAVIRLRRTSIGPVELGDLKPGCHRRLTDREMALLRRNLVSPRSRDPKSQRTPK
jgi:23S rRNA pseudouridine2605 synthase